MASDDAIDFGKAKVCPQCKPEYAQRLREGVANAELNKDADR